MIRALVRLVVIEASASRDEQPRRDLHIVMDEDAGPRGACTSAGSVPGGSNREPVGRDAGDPGVARRRTAKLDLDRGRLTSFAVHVRR